MKNIVTALTVFSILLLSFPSLADTKLASYQTFCFGRYLIDVPTTAVLASSGNKYIAGSIDAHRTTQDGFVRMIDEVKQSLKEQPDKGDFQYSGERFSHDRNRRIILSVAHPYGSTGYRIDAFRMTQNGFAFVTSALDMDEKKINYAIASYEAYLDRVRYRSNRELPKEPGFCVDNGFVANDGKASQDEQANLYFKLKDHPDVGIRIESQVYFKQEKPMLERIKEGEVGAVAQFFSRIKTLREGPKTINGMAGEESLDKGPSDEQIGYAHNLTWETLGKLGDPLHPLIHFEIITGGAEGESTTPSSMSDKEVIALYDRIVSTIRIRPTR